MRDTASQNNVFEYNIKIMFLTGSPSKPWAPGIPERPCSP